MKLVDKKNFDEHCNLFTVHFKSLYTNIPVKHTIELMLENSLMVFQKEYFQPIFGIIMGTNVAHKFIFGKLEKIERKNQK